MRQFYFLFLFFVCFSARSQGKWVGHQYAGQERQWIFFENSEQQRLSLDSLLQSYREEGYIGAYWHYEKEKQDSVWLSLTPGPQISEVYLRKGNLPENVVRNLKLGELTLSESQGLLHQILRESENLGHPFASVGLDSLDRKGSILSASINYDAGPLIRWDSLLVGGSSKTNPKYLQRLTGIVPGTLFSQQELEAANRSLQRSPYFKVLQPASLTFQIQKAQPTFHIQDQNANVLDGIIGFLPNENEPGKLLITGQLDLQLYHLGGRGRDILLSWQRFNALTQSLELEAKESYIFNSALDLKGNFSLLKQDTTFIKRNLGLQFGYRFHPDWYITFLGNRVASDLISSVGYETITALPEVADFRWSEYGISTEWNRLDDAFAPRRGFKLEMRMSAGKKRILENTGLPPEIYEGLTLTSTQFAGDLHWQQHFFVRANWGIYVAGAAGLIENKNLLINDLYRLGGLKSIRGFNENFFYASSFGYLTMEQRLFFGQNSFLLLFLDGGLLENPYLASSKDHAIATGAGLNFETGSGVFRFIYAVGKSSQQPFSFAQSKIHFGYLARF
ncbi:BamA/TamA family outer membrane protein [Algoriphagus vanfongensis]|uniref:BamA/TamA family outer membrane protein n=1 Tax=Algoriphagus vanfongensis TaxID=426371 RepID=UPI000406F7B6|nr:BamA/TamA family outer membrane protein [Algoriphagus vanfongensis]